MRRIANKFLIFFGVFFFVLADIDVVVDLSFNVFPGNKKIYDLCMVGYANLNIDFEFQVPLKFIFCLKTKNNVTE